MPRIIVIPSTRYAPAPTAPSLIADVAGTQVTLTAGSTPAPGQTITYTFERATASPGAFALLATTTATTTTSIEVAGTTTYYRVIATQTDGQTSGYSATASATIAASGFSPNFPRIGYGYLSPAQWGNSANDARLANVSVLIFTHWNGAQSVAGRTLRSAIDAIKALVPGAMSANPVHAAYIVNDEVYDAGTGDSSTQRIRDECVANSRYLYVTGASGTIVESSFSASLDLINRTSGAHSAGGKTWPQWHADLVYVQNVVGEAGNTANPSLDAMLLDNAYWKPRRDGDWNRDGTTDSASDAAFATAERTGIKAHFDYLRSIWPAARFQLGNTTDLYASDAANIYNSSYTPNTSLISPLAGVIDGGLAGEYLLTNGSEPYSLEWQERANGLVGFQAVRNVLKFFHTALAHPATAFYSVRDVTGDLTAADYQRLRFGAALITVCSNGGIDDRRILSWATLPLIYTDGGNVGWLGQAIDTPQWTSYQAGVYRREFANGFVLVNPRNNGTQNVTLAVNVRDVHTGTSYTAGSNLPLADRDGMFVRKT